MQEELPGFEESQEMRMENDFMKMKMMLEKGAQFEKLSDDCTPEMENDFLKYIIEFERQSENPERIKLFEKVDSPTQFIRADDVADEDINKALEDVLEWLDKYNIHVDACSPNVSKRELYRFIVEELFEEEIDNINIPGMIHGFIYDEFHPDPVYENSRMAINDGITQLLRQEKMEWMHHYRNENLQLNDHFPLTREGFRSRINDFKEKIANVEMFDVDDVKCMVEGDQSFVKGSYFWKAEFMGEPVYREGKWLVNLEHNKETGYWYIFSVEIEGMEF